MNTRKNIQRLFHLVGSALMVLSIFSASPAPRALAAAPADPLLASCATNVSGTLTGKLTWTTAGSPYCLTGTTIIDKNSTLTVQSGVQVLGGLQTWLEVQGTLNASGASFSSLINSSAGEWVGLVFNGAFGLGRGTLDHVTIRYGGENYDGRNANVILVSGASATITNSVIANSIGRGVYADQNSKLTLSQSTLQNNASYPLAVPAGVVGNLSGNTFGGNSPDRVLVDESGSSTLNANATWRADNGSGIYEIAETVTVGTGVTLTINPGVKIMARPQRLILVYGTLNVPGTSALPVTFTSSMDSAAGQWIGLVFDGTFGFGRGTLSYANLRFGGEDYYGRNFNLGLFAGADVTVSNSSLVSSQGYGVFVDTNTKLALTGSTVSKSARAPLWLLASDLSGIQNNTFTDNGTNLLRTVNGPLDMTFASTFSATNVLEAYELEGDLNVLSNGALTAEAGATVRARSAMGIYVAGSLNATGTKDKPVLFSAASANPTPGFWHGLYYQGSSGAPAAGSLQYTTVEYAGQGSAPKANIYIVNGAVSMMHVVISNSAGDGLLADVGGFQSQVTLSNIVNNAGYGIKNTQPDTVMTAVDNWWGAPSGPTADNNCNPGGTGSRVSAGVVYKPFITDPNTPPSPLSPRDMGFIEITPLRWYVPADSNSQAYFTVTLRDGSGLVLPNQPVHLVTSLGSLSLVNVTTNAQGQASAYITSSAVGDAKITALPGGGATACAMLFQSGETTIHFTQDPASLLFPNQQAPYLTSGLDVSPQPVTQGVPSKIILHVTNPLAQSISINGTVGFAQLGIGMAFGPVAAVNNWVVPAKSTGDFTIDWTPPLSGHYCLQFTYSYGPVGASPTRINGSGGKVQHNMNVWPGGMLNPTAKNAAQEAQKRIAQIGDGNYILALKQGRDGIAGIPTSLVQDQLFGNILDFNFDSFGAAICALQGGANCGGWKGPRLQLPGGGIGSLFEDPPSQDYKSLATADPIPFTPLLPSSQLPTARAKALNDLMSASLNFTVNLMAAVASYDRYGGASAANDSYWSTQQANAFLYFVNQFAHASIATADALDALNAELEAEGHPDWIVTPDVIQAYEARLASSGFDATEITAAHQVGLEDAQIEKIRQRRMAVDPYKEATSVMTAWSNIAIALRALGNFILYPPIPPMSSSASAGSLHNATAASVKLAHIQPLVETFVVGNPTGQTAVINLKVLRIDIPVDWQVSLSADTVMLEPGQQQTITVTITPSIAVIQGTQPRIAIEGYVGATLLGGVVMDVMVPQQAALATGSNVYLPVIEH